ncbi:MAG TPA: cutinase family protein [Mycobacterium sp.]|nr:cutinase family protein [Mycobacterium sp.]
MAKKKTRRRNFAVVLAIVLVVLGVASGLLWWWHNRPGAKVVQAAGCPDVMLVSIPGTWESSPQQDPLNPTQFPNALLLNVTRPLTQQFDKSRLEAYTVPYTAQFRRPGGDSTELTYNDSRKEGTATTEKAIADMHANCLLTRYVIVGFSQGAVIGGDIASDIGNGRGPVDDDLVLGVTLIADGRRQDGVGQHVPPDPPGQGAEITLRDVPLVSSGAGLLGITLTGPRTGGFGALNDRTNEICAPGDLICAAPVEAMNPINLPETLRTLMGAAGQPVHASYNTTKFWSSNGQPATVWTRDWAARVIDKAPHPAHA